MTYRVQLEVYQGPFDLLLQLISRRKLDIYEIDLSEITAEFLAHLGGLEELDLETATHFLVVAATLIEVKAVRLLPKQEQDELEDTLSEVRDLLYARLLEYRAFRDAAVTLQALLEANEGHVGREVRLEPRFRHLVPDTPLTIDAEGLAGLAAVALAPRPEPHVDLSHLKHRYLSVRNAAVQLLTRMPHRGARSTFAELTEGMGRGDKVAVFLAILELYKLGSLVVAQDAPFGPLTVERTTEGLPEALPTVGIEVDGVGAEHAERTSPERALWGVEPDQGLPPGVAGGADRASASERGSTPGAGGAKGADPGPGGSERPEGARWGVEPR